MRRRSKRIFYRLTRFLLGAALSLCLVAAGILILWVATLKVPNLNTFELRRVSESTKLYDRTGTVLLYDVHENIKRTVTSFEEMSRHIKNATVAIEDAEFYKHQGIKPKSILRALIVNLKRRGFSQGGSTITQQVVKNALLTREKNISRKLKEWILALKLERMMNKEEILTLYLNEVSYGGNLYGIEEASLAYFGKHARELGLAESAYLASLPKAPTFFSPYGNNRDHLEARRHLVLSKMKENGFISDEEYERALAEKVDFKPPENIGIKAPHFVIFVKQYLEEKYGERTVEEGGIKVITTLDYELQEKAEEVVEKFARSNKVNFEAENAGLVTIDPKTGQILTMVGSRNYFDKEIDGNFNVTLAKRQPGSAFKPFVYAEAFRKGYLPETVLFDLDTEFETRCTPQGKPISGRFDAGDCYSPRNYDNKFRGQISLRSALGQSINIPSVKVLYLAGVGDSIIFARRAGISTLEDPNRYGLTLVLGGGEVTLLELTSAYMVFATEGIRHPYTAILEIRDRRGKILEKFEKHGEQILEPEIARKISDILADDAARSPLTGVRNPNFYFEDRDVAIKTGTTNDNRDAWIVGYTPQLVVGAWAGNNDNRPMVRKVAGFIVAPLWNAFVRQAIKNISAERFTKPEPPDPNTKPTLRGRYEGNRTYVIDSVSGKLATQYTPTDTMVEKTVREIHTILYWLDRHNPLGPPPSRPQDDPQFSHWEYPIREWAKANGINDEGEEVIPKEYDDVHLPQYFPILKVTGITDSEEYESGSKISFTVTNNGRYPLSKVEVFLNGSYLGKDESDTFLFSFVPADLDTVTSENELRIVGTDSVMNKGEVVLKFRVKS